MKYVYIADATGKELERHPVDNDVIVPAAKLTAEVWNRDHPSDDWQVKIDASEEPVE